MSTITVPNFGESVNSVTISRWHLQTGDTVKPGDIIATLETDKVASDLEAEEAGTLEILVQEGQDADIGAPIGNISPAGTAKTAETETSPPLASPQKTENPVKATPPPASPAPQPSTPGEQQNSARFTRTRLSKIRRTIAAKLVDVQHQAAILTTFNECDMTAIMSIRKQFKQNTPPDSTARLGIMSFFIKAVVHALKEVPELNARIDGDDLIQHHYYDISIAIGTDHGLVVPVLRDCHQKSHLELEAGLASLAAKAREGTLQLADLQGGVFTISNGGTYGSMLSTPILNPPQSGILGMHAILDRPIARDGKIEIRPMMYLALSYDHRIIDGKQAVTFLKHIKDSLENPLLEL